MEKLTEVPFGILSVKLPSMPVTPKDFLLESIILIPAIASLSLLSTTIPFNVILDCWAKLKFTEKRLMVINNTHGSRTNFLREINGSKDAFKFAVDFCKSLPK